MSDSKISYYGLLLILIGLNEIMITNSNVLKLIAAFVVSSGLIFIVYKYFKLAKHNIILKVILYLVIAYYSIVAVYALTIVGGIALLIVLSKSVLIAIASLFELKKLKRDFV